MDSPISNGAKLRSDGPRNGLLKLAIDGRLDADSTGRVWRDSIRLVAAARAATVNLDASAMDYCDGSGIALLIQLRRLQQKAGGKLEIHGLRPEFQELLDDWSQGSSDTTPSKAKVRVPLAEEVGRSAVQLWDDVREVISFIGQLGLALVKAALHPSMVRWRDTLLVAEELGVNALPIVALLSFLVGVIMAFQAAVALRQFGAEIFVANLIGLSVLREMGPLMTAIILAGRSGSAFAAEIGTMKVREEIDALKTMGLEPVRFLVVPRVLAARGHDAAAHGVRRSVRRDGRLRGHDVSRLSADHFFSSTPVGGELRFFGRRAGQGLRLRHPDRRHRLLARPANRDRRQRRRLVHHPRGGERHHSDRHHRRDFFGDLLLPLGLTSTHDRPATTLIRVEGFTAAYDGQVILKQLSFEVYRGEVFVILGGSGCGKSTLLKHMIGLYAPAAGTILIDGDDIATVEGARAPTTIYENSASCIRAARCSAR